MRIESQIQETSPDEMPTMALYTAKTSSQGRGKKCLAILFSSW